MKARLEHLQTLADPATQRTLNALCLEWSVLDGNCAGALSLRRQQPGAVSFAGLIGGASSGKSTLFNSLVQREVSRISAHAHETLGPIAAVPPHAAQSVRLWIQQHRLLGGGGVVEVDGAAPVAGAAAAVHLVDCPLAGNAEVVLVDLPDVTSKMSADEGAVSRNLLPWFDGLIIVVDEERWFDAAVFDDTVEFARNFGPRLWVVFNRTEHAAELTPEQRQQLEVHAAERRADDACISPFQSGRGYRPVSEATRERIAVWLGGLREVDRSAPLGSYVHRRCSELLRANVARSRHFNELRRAIDEQVASHTEQARLSLDLLTDEERRLLGMGYRFVPLYDVFVGVRRQLEGLLGRRRPAGDIDFDKAREQLAEVLRRNLEHRFRHATDTIGRIISQSPYTTGGVGDWQPQWRTPTFDEREWAARIRAHIDAWKAESAKQSRRGDLGALTVGMPLLVADLLLLGGAGITATWVAAWVAGFFGGKGLVQLFNKSSAFQDYQTTVGAYQTLIREALLEQCEANLASLPQRHLPMSDPIMEAALAWSRPG